MLPLSNLPKGTKKNSPRLLQWSEEAEASLHTGKGRLADLTLLAHPVLYVPTVLTTDASSEAVSAILQQEVHGELVPIVFRKRLETLQRKYSAFDRELLAVFEAV